MLLEQQAEKLRLEGPPSFYLRGALRFQVMEIAYCKVQV